MKLITKKGTTSKIIRLFVKDSSVTTGVGLAGLVFNSAGLTAYYTREGAASATAITLVTATVGTWTSSGFIEVDAVNMPGIYELHLPDAVLASGADSVMVFLKGAANMMPSSTEIQLGVDVNTIEISGDSTAADNVEATYDGTGYADDSAPATQEQIGRLTSGTAAINATVESFTKTHGSETGTYANTVALDGTSHIVADVANATDAYYQFDVGGNGVPVAIFWQGYAQSKGDSYTIWAYNYSSATYEQVGTIHGTNGTTIVDETFPLSIAHVGTGGDKGKVRFRFLSGDGAVFATDRLLCSYAVITKSVGYSEGAIWVNTNASNTNTEDYVDGTADNPVSSWTAAKTLSASLGIKKFHIVNGSTVTIDTNCDDYTFVGYDYAIQLEGYQFENTHIENATVTGVGTSGTGEIHFNGCSIGTCEIGKSHIVECGMYGTITVSAAETYIVDRCHNAACGSVPPIIDFGSSVGDTHCAFRNWQGGIEVANLGANGSDVFSVTGGGKIFIAATCAGGTIKAVGHFTIADSVVDGFPGTIEEDARYDVYQINNECDTALVDYAPSTATALSAHDTKLDTVDAIIDRILLATEIRQCTVVDASPAALSFETSLTETGSQFWKRAVIRVTSGDNEGQMRAIDGYNRTSKKITLKTPLNTAPANGDSFIIIADRKYLTADIEDLINAVWDEPTASHTTAGTFGKLMRHIRNGVDAIIGRIC